MDCAHPGKLFCSTQIPVCLWFVAKNENADAKRGFCDSRKRTLFIEVILARGIANNEAARNT
jgi:type I restriction enzyme M protein